MGRYKKHKTKQAQRDRKREKSSKYYYNHRDDILRKKREEINETDMNEWIDPDKITLSFVWFCFSKLNEEQIGSNLMEFRDEFKNELRKHLEQKNKEQLQTDDEEVKDKVERDIEIEIKKNEDRLINQTISDLGFTKDDWKETLGLDKWKNYEIGVS